MFFAYIMLLSIAALDRCVCLLRWPCGTQTFAFDGLDRTDLALIPSLARSVWFRGELGFLLILGIFTYFAISSLLRVNVENHARLHSQVILGIMEMLF